MANVFSMIAAVGAAERLLHNSQINKPIGHSKIGHLTDAFDLPDPDNPFKQGKNVKKKGGAKFFYLL